MKSVGGGIRKVMCCDTPEIQNNPHTGDGVCVMCGLVVMQHMFFETEHSMQFSDTHMNVHSSDSPGIDECEPLNVNNCYTTSTSDDKKEQRWLDRMNASVTYTNDQRTAWKLRSVMTESMPSLSPQITNAVQQVLNEWVIDKNRRSLSGANRRGFIAACVYRACQLFDEQMEMDHICMCFGICHSSFFNGRRVLYDWNKSSGRCDWFCKTDDSSK